jgi:hypothetical protein
MERGKGGAVRILRGGSGIAVGIRRQLAASVYDAGGSGDAIERGKEAIKAKHVVGSLAGSQGLIPLDGLHSISVPLLSPPRTPVDLQIAASVFSSFFPIISVHPSPLVLFLPQHPSATAGSNDKLTHSSPHSPLPFPSPSHPLTTSSTVSL